MLLSAQKVETNCGLPSENFRIETSPIAFQILSKNLYSDNIMAIVRELLSNAYEAHLKAGNLNKPIDVQLPTNLVPTFRIRDYGTGLSLDQFRNLYTVFFKSSKRETNDFTGCFGLGSKSPYAYADIFTVTSYHKGMLYQAICSKSSECPEFRIVRQEETSEPDGLEITLGVQKEDAHRFVNKFKFYSEFVPELNTNPYTINADDTVSKILLTNKVFYADVSDLGIISKIGIHLDRDHDYYVKQGQNVFRLGNDLELGKEFNLDVYLYQVFERLKLVFEFPVGTLNITPSREDLMHDETFRNVFNEAYLEISKHFGKIKKRLIAGITELLSRPELHDQYITVASEIYSNLIHIRKQLNFSYYFTRCSYNPIKTYDFMFVVQSNNSDKHYHCYHKTYNAREKILNRIVVGNSLKTLVVFDNRKSAGSNKTEQAYATKFLSENPEYHLVSFIHVIPKYTIQEMRILGGEKGEVVPDFIKNLYCLRGIKKQVNAVCEAFHEHIKHSEYPLDFSLKFISMKSLKKICKISRTSSKPVNLNEISTYCFSLKISSMRHSSFAECLSHGKVKLDYLKEQVEQNNTVIICNNIRDGFRRSEHLYDAFMEMDISRGKRIIEEVLPENTETIYYIGTKSCSRLRELGIPFFLQSELNKKLKDKVFIIDPELRRISRLNSHYLTTACDRLQKYLDKNKNKKIVQKILKSFYYKWFITSTRIISKMSKVIQYGTILSKKGTICSFYSLNENQVIDREGTVNLMNILNPPEIERVLGMAGYNDTGFVRKLIPYFLNKS